MGTIICPNCHTENPENSSFCQACGKSFQSAAVPTDDQTRVVTRGKQAGAEMPPPPPAVMAPPPPPQGSIGAVPPRPQFAAYVQATPIQNLGVCKDNWNDVIEGGAPIAEKVRQEFENNLKAAEIPGLHVAQSNLGGKNGEMRNYEVVSFGRGTTIIVRVASFGKHLAVSWDLYARQSINWLTVGILAGSVFVLTFLTHILGSVFESGFFYGLFSWWGTFLNWLLVPGLAILLAGKIMRGDWLAFYRTDDGEFAEDDALALTTVTDIALSDAIEKALEAE